MGANLIPDGAERRRVAVPVPVGGGRGGVELARDRERRGVAGGLPHPVPVRRRLLRRRRRRSSRRVLHLCAGDGRIGGPPPVDLSARGTRREPEGEVARRGRVHSNSDSWLPLLWSLVSELPLRPMAWARVPDASGTFPAVHAW